MIGYAKLRVSTETLGVTGNHILTFVKGEIITAKQKPIMAIAIEGF